LCFIYLNETPSPPKKQEHFLSEMSKVQGQALSPAKAGLLTGSWRTIHRAGGQFTARLKKSSRTGSVS
jgi:hypothetical protein